MTKDIEINGVKFVPQKGINYKYDYATIAKEIARKKKRKDFNPKLHELSYYRALILNDLWFIAYFVLKIKEFNHPFIVDACKEVERGPKTNTLDFWARVHGKTSIITTAESLQKVLNDAERRIAIFSHTRPVAKGILRGIKITLEHSDILKDSFEDKLWKKPESESPKWSEDDGLVIKREGFFRESTFEAWGLLEGMPIGKHFTDGYFDDIETEDVVDSPETVGKLRKRYHLAENLGVESWNTRTIGTYYTHDGLLTYLRDLEDKKGNPLFHIRKKPATEDGTKEGKPVFISQERLDFLKSDEYTFRCQQLLDPTPIDTKTLSGDLLVEVDRFDIPNDLLIFMVIDSAGDEKKQKTGKSDYWAIHVVGVDPNMDNIGASEIFILDTTIERLREAEAQEIEGCLPRLL